MDFVSFDDIDIKGSLFFFLLIFLFSLTFLFSLKFKKSNLIGITHDFILYALQSITNFGKNQNSKFDVGRSSISSFIPIQSKRFFFFLVPVSIQDSISTFFLRPKWRILQSKYFLCELFSVSIISSSVRCLLTGIPPDISNNFLLSIL